MRKVRIQVFCSYPVCLTLHRYKWLNIIMSIKITISRDLYIMVVCYSWYQMPLKQRAPWNYFFFLINEIQLCLLTNKVKVKSLSCPTLCNPMDSSPPGSSVHGILQARVLEWAAISFSRDPFPTQGSNTGPLHCRQMLYHLSHQGSLCLLWKLHFINISYKYMKKVHIKVPVHHCCHLSHSPCQLPKGWWPPKTLKRQWIYTAVLIHLIPEYLPQSI